MKLMACQIRPGTFRPRVVAIASMTVALLACSLDLSDEDEGDHERIDCDRFGEAKADEQRHQDWTDHLGIAADRFHGLTDAVADANTRPDRPKANSDGGCPNVRSGCR